MTAQAIRAARVLPSSSSQLIQDGVVLVQGDRIKLVGQWATLEKDLEGVPVRDLGDVTLMPGLFDCHVHLQLDPSGINTSTEVSATDEELIPFMAVNASRLLDAGVTTARDLGSRGMTAILLRDKIKKGEVIGPRLQCANAPLTVEKGHAHAMGGVCRGVEGVRAEVRKRHAEGADLIKVMATGGFMTAGSHPSKACFSLEEMTAIADEARRLGMPVTTHATGTEGIERAADARFSSIEHCAWITESGNATFDKRVAQKLLDNKLAVCPTMNTACVEHDYFCPWDKREVIVSNLRSLRDMGIRIMVGTDAGIGFCPFERYADGLTVLADAGYTPREIIAAATDIAAKECGLSEETGKLKPGYAADLAAFSGNPLEDIRAFAEPRFVMACGREHKELRPIPPVGDVSDAKTMTLQVLRRGAGLQTQA
ncbi:hypothetical protein MRS44_017405 [Fusarium solani]|uniref:uncharacterized protein n=1 Tax=Fusarium solani TaxID=169388 RepID=UPI00231C0A81|nr:hypothetical protein MRS44_017405 [Fusarium solani]KAJ4208856.1 hypothetical protein NW759_013618 [Fusarium solani]